MLRVGLTGGLGSGKSTAADIFHSLGAHIIKADQIGRDLMQPGQAVYRQIVSHFGPTIVAANGELDRPALAQLVFDGEAAQNHLDALNAIVHPAVIAVQLDWMNQIAEREPKAIAIVESALIFETKFADDMRRFDHILLVTAPDDLKISRFVARSLSGRTSSPAQQAALEADARQRLTHQIHDEEKAPYCDFILNNSGSLAHLEKQVRSIYNLLKSEASAPRPVNNSRPI